MTTESFIDRLKIDAQHGDIDAQYRLACCYAGGTDTEKDEAEAKKWMRLAAEQGHADAQKMLGWDDVGLGYAGGEPMPRLNWLRPMELLFRFIVSKGRWPVVRFFGLLGLLDGVFAPLGGLIFGTNDWLFFDIVPMTPMTVFLHCIIAISACIIGGLVLYEIARCAFEPEP